MNTIRVSSSRPVKESRSEILDSKDKKIDILFGQVFDLRRKRIKSSRISILESQIVVLIGEC